MKFFLKMRLRRVLSLSILVLSPWIVGVGLKGCHSTTDSALVIAQESLDLDGQEAAIADIRSTLEQLESEGLYGVVQLKDGESVLIHEGLGLRDRESSDPIETTTGFDIGSLTKAMTAATGLKLEEQGALRLSDPVRLFFPEAPSPLREATVQQLIEHRAGLPEYLGEDTELLTKEQALERLFAAELDLAPGSDEAYSNAGYSLLAAIVEATANQPFEQAMHEAIFLPAGIDSIGYRLAGWEKERLAVGYVEGERTGTPLDQPWLDDGPSWTLRGNGGLIATAEDTADWFDAMFAGRILGPAALAQFKAWFASSGPYGVRVGEAGGDDLTGFNAQYEAWPDVGISWTMFTSRSDYLAEDVWEAVEDPVEQLLEPVLSPEDSTTEEEEEES
ncbi:MAG: serine hydrolase domain-containing protein [Phormidesmis sp.]